MGIEEERARVDYIRTELAWLKESAVVSYMRDGGRWSRRLRWLQEYWPEGAPCDSSRTLCSDLTEGFAAIDCVEWLAREVREIRRSLGYTGPEIGRMIDAWRRA